MFGFKCTNTLPPCRVGVSHKKPKVAEFRVGDMEENRVAFNVVVCSAVEPTKFWQDLMDCAMEDSEEGCVTVSQKVADLDFSDAHVSRRIAIRE